MDILLIWLVFVFVFLIIRLFILGRKKREAGNAIQNGVLANSLLDPMVLADFQQRIWPVLAVTGYEVRGPGVTFEGRLRIDPNDALIHLREAFVHEKLTPLLTEGRTHDQVSIALVPGIEELARPASSSDRPKWFVHVVLFVCTLITTTWAGALHAGADPIKAPAQLLVGLPFSFGLMLILGAHELGHYLTARRHGIRVTPPYFIPVPFGLGTFGAFIKLKSMAPDRRAAFDVAVAGPLAGLFFAIPALLIGLRYSHIINTVPTPDALQTGVQIGSSFLLAILTKFALAAETMQGQQLVLHPLAFAGWLGLVVTALNLLPIGQLDGGHISHAMFGARRGHAIGVGALMTLFALALFVWPGLMMWAWIVWFIAGTRDVPPLDDLTPLDRSRRLLGWFSFLILAAILVPVPHALYPSFGIHCPYL